MLQLGMLVKPLSQAMPFLSSKKIQELHTLLSTVTLSDGDIEKLSALLKKTRRSPYAIG